MTMNMTRRFGVEIEFVGLNPQRAAEIVNAAGVACSFEGYTHRVMSSWKVVTDASVRGGAEIVSPPLEGEDGLNQLRTVLDALNNAGAGVRRSCGVHVHIEAAGMDASWIANVLNRYARFEGDIDAFMPPSRRGSANQYCKSLSRTRWNGNDVRSMANSMGCRYYKVNLQSYLKYGTLEFRQHAGSLNFAKISNWIGLLQQFVEASRPEAAAASVPSRSASRPRRRVLAAVNAYPGTTQNQLADILGSSPMAVNTHLRALLADGTLRRVRAGRSYQYHVANVQPRRTDAPREGDTLWTGVADSIREFFNVRRAVLAS